MTNRRGTTLLEVLVAIFVMGIGLLALLTLFPLGALRMAQAIQDDRCAQCCRIANNTAEFQKVRNDLFVIDVSKDLTFPPAYVTTDSFANPWPGNLLPADPDGPSYPVFVDPTGYLTATGLISQTWLTPNAGTIPRRKVSFFTPFNSTNCLRWFTLLDDVNFDIDGTPKYPSATPGNFERDIRYSWAYMLKRPRSSNRSIVELTVVVFNKRTLALSNNLDLNEYLYQGAEVAFDAAKNTITVDVTSSANALPPVRSGDWLLDASYVPCSTNPAAYASANGNFYRVVAVTELTNTQIEYEVQPTLRNVNMPNATNKLIVMDGIAEVFEKGTGRLP